MRKIIVGAQVPHEARGLRFADAVDPVSTRSASKPWMVRTGRRRRERCQDDGKVFQEPTRE